METHFIGLFKYWIMKIESKFRCKVSSIVIYVMRQNYFDSVTKIRTPIKNLKKWSNKKLLKDSQTQLILWKSIIQRHVEKTQLFMF